MNKLPGVILFIVLGLVILQIVTLRVLSQAEKRIIALETKVAAIQATEKNATPSTAISTQSQ
jgi:hypothetical protein